MSPGRQPVWADHRGDTCARLSLVTGPGYSAVIGQDPGARVSGQSLVSCCIVKSPPARPRSSRDIPDTPPPSLRTGCPRKNSDKSDRLKNSIITDKTTQSLRRRFSTNQIFALIQSEIEPQTLGPSVRDNAFLKPM